MDIDKNHCCFDNFEQNECKKCSNKWQTNETHNSFYFKECKCKKCIFATEIMNNFYEKNKIFFTKNHCCHSNFVKQKFHYQCLLCHNIAIKKNNKMLNMIMI